MFSKKFLTYLKEVILQIKQITWPTKKKLVDYVVVVLFVTFVAGMFLGLVDWLFLNFFRRFIF